MEWTSQHAIAGRAARGIDADTDMAFARWPRPILAKPGVRGWTDGLAGEKIRVRVHSDQVMGRFSQIEAMVQPGKDLLRVRHRSTDLLIHVMQGRLRLFYDATSIEAGPGTVVALPRDTVHGWLASGHTPLALMLTYTPGGIEALIRACHGLTGSDLQFIAQTFGTEILDAATE
jgi:quercetin dioxygenase-like cupin family protein